MRKIDKDSIFYVLGQNSIAAVDRAIMEALRFGLTQHPKGFGICVTVGDDGPKVEFFTEEDADHKAIKLCEEVIERQRSRVVEILDYQTKRNSNVDN